MIVLDATNKTLALKSNTASNMFLHAVVSYWLVDALNVWTPKQFEQSWTAAAPPGSWSGNGNHGILLAPPGAGETKVVENIWLHPIQITSGELRVVVGTPVGNTLTERTFASFLNLSNGTTLSMNRWGVWGRQANSHTGTAVSQIQT